MKPLTIFCCLLIIISCKEKDVPLTAQQIVDKAIYVSCNGNCETVRIEFEFRGKKYVSEQNGGAFQYDRITNDSTGITLDRLSNNGFTRYKNDTLVKVVDSMVSRYSESVNSVHYFVQLPFGLNAAAVLKQLLGEDEIKGQPYYEIGVTFKEEGGGTDFDDSFVYWIHKENFTVDYLAYKYATNGGGIRFREAYNVRVVNGVRITDYNNFKPNSLDISLTELDSLFEDGQLELLSKIETEHPKVSLIND